MIEHGAKRGYHLCELEACSIPYNNSQHFAHITELIQSNNFSHKSLFLKPIHATFPFPFKKKIDHQTKPTPAKRILRISIKQSWFRTSILGRSSQEPVLPDFGNSEGSFWTEPVLTNSCKAFVNAKFSWLVLSPHAGNPVWGRGWVALS